MSSMLEQAIIDADALKEAATKNAETLVLEKYSNQIKSAVETLLEQDVAEDLGAELGLGAETTEDPMAAASDQETKSPDSTVLQHIPMAVTSDNDDQVEIPLDALLEEVTRLSESMNFPQGDSVELEGLSEDLFPDEGADPELEEEIELEEAMELEEEIELEEEFELEEDLLEALVVDHKPVKSGWAGTPQGTIELAEEEILALEQDSKIREENDAIRNAVKELSTVNEAISTQNKKLTDTLNKSASYMTKLRDAVSVLEEKLDKASLENAKLLYQNKALTSDSLNERQKQKLAEAVSNAETIEEAKVIFETLQSTVGSTARKQQPNSLSEAVQKTSSIILSSRKENSDGRKVDPTLNRWKFLAGIDK